MPELMYLSIPSRMKHLGSEIEKFARDKGYAGWNPLKNLPYEDFEGNPDFGRARTIDLCCIMVEKFPVFGLFGISDGTMQEFNYALSANRQIRVWKEKDAEWEKFYNYLIEEQRRKIDKAISRQ